LDGNRNRENLPHIAELKEKMAQMYGKIPVQYTMYLPGRSEQKP
jgi:hypothetical protein